MPVVLKATAHLTTLFQRCKPRKQLPKNPTLRNPGPRTKAGRQQSPRLLCSAAMSPSSLIARKKRRSIRKRSKIGKTLLQLPRTISLRVKKAIKSATIARKKAIFQDTSQNLQKTSISLGKLCASN